MSITQKELKKLLHYSKKFGLFIWKVHRGGKATKGSIAGRKTKDGYIVIKFFGKGYLAHRLAFLYVKGRFPKDQTDHKDRVRDNNKWKNLRESTNKKNSMNRNRPRLSKDNTSGITGVTKRGQSWTSQIYTNERYIHLGSFQTKKEAKKARRKAEKQYQTG